MDDNKKISQVKSIEHSDGKKVVFFSPNEQLQALKQNEALEADTGKARRGLQFIHVTTEE